MPTPKPSSRSRRANGWLKQHGNPYALSVLDLDGRVGIDYGVYGVPETYVIDKLGIIRMKHTGPISPDGVLDKNPAAGRGVEQMNLEKAVNHEGHGEHEEKQDIELSKLLTQWVRIETVLFSAFLGDLCPTGIGFAACLRGFELRL